MPGTKTRPPAVAVTDSVDFYEFWKADTIVRRGYEQAIERMQDILNS